METAEDGDDDEEGAGSSWKQEMESIMAGACTRHPACALVGRARHLPILNLLFYAGTHPALVEGLTKHDQVMKREVAQAERLRHLQTVNINNLFDCEKKASEDEKKVPARLHRSALPHDAARVRASLCGARREALPTPDTDVATWR